MHAARRPDLPAEAALDVVDRVEVAVEDLPQQGDVRDGQPQGVDLRQPLLVREGWDVTTELLEGGVDAGAVARPLGLPGGVDPQGVEVLRPLLGLLVLGRGQVGVERVGGWVELPALPLLHVVVGVVG